MLMEIQWGRELWSLNDVATEFADMQRGIRIATGHCILCRQAIPDPSAIVGDIDQCFEQCTAANAACAWAAVSTEYERRFDSVHVDVHRGRKEHSRRAAASGWSPSWWRLSLQEITTAVTAFTWMTLATVAGCTMQLQGVAMGGVLSSFLVAVILCVRE